MATPGEDDESKTETTLDVAGFIRVFASQGDPDDDENTENRTGEVSMFCKACLHPYCGEEKAGTIVLRCERCGQTDTILEEKIGSLNPEEWIGNLMMNRFMQVVKEQEDLSANLADPDLIDDEYRRMSYAMDNLVANLQRLADALLRVAKRLSIVPETAVIDFCGEIRVSPYGQDVLQAMNVIRTLIEIHRILASGISMSDENRKQTQTTSDHIQENAQSSEEDAEALEAMDQTDLKQKVNDADDSAAEKLQTVSNGAEELLSENNNVHTCKKVDSVTCDEFADKGSGAAASEECELRENDDKISAEIQNLLGRIAPTVLKLIEALIGQYSLPDDIMVNIRERVTGKANDNAVVDCDDTQTNQEAGRNIDNDTIDQNKPEKTSEETVSNDTSTEEVEDDENRSDDDDSKIFNVSTKHIQEELDKNLKHKLRLRIEFPTTVSASSKEKEQKRADSKIAVTDSKFETEACQPAVNDDQLQHKELDVNGMNERTENSCDKFEERRQEQKDILEEGNSIQKRKNENCDLQNSDDGFYVNIYTLAAEFVRELQRRRSDALTHRKVEALTKMHAKLDELKEEMSKVGKAVTNELRQAYKTKMQKVENQQRHLDEKKQQLKEAERLMHFYAMTGQEEKLAELMAQINMLTNKS